MQNLLSIITFLPLASVVAGMRASCGAGPSMAGAAAQPPRRCQRA